MKGKKVDAKLDFKTCIGFLGTINKAFEMHENFIKYQGFSIDKLETMLNESVDAKNYLLANELKNVIELRKSVKEKVK